MRPARAFKPFGDQDLRCPSAKDIEILYLTCLNREIALLLSQPKIHCFPADLAVFQLGAYLLQVLGFQARRFVLQTELAACKIAARPPHGPYRLWSKRLIGHMKTSLLCAHDAVAQTSQPWQGIEYKREQLTRRLRPP